jgi:hypothetical protein
MTLAGSSREEQVSLFGGVTELAKIYMANGVSFCSSSRSKKTYRPWCSEPLA